MRILKEWGGAALIVLLVLAMAVGGALQLHADVEAQCAKDGGVRQWSPAQLVKNGDGYIEYSAGRHCVNPETGVIIW